MGIWGSVWFRVNKIVISAIAFWDDDNDDGDDDDDHDDDDGDDDDDDGDADDDYDYDYDDVFRWLVYVFLRSLPLTINIYIQHLRKQNSVGAKKISFASWEAGIHHILSPWATMVTLTLKSLFFLNFF